MPHEKRSLKLRRLLRSMFAVFCRSFLLLLGSTGIQIFLFVISRREFLFIYAGLLWAWQDFSSIKEETFTV